MPSKQSLKSSAINGARKAVRHAPLGPIALLPKQGGTPGRSALVARARHLIKTGRPLEALRLVDRGPVESLPANLSAVRAEALWAAGRSTEALAAIRPVTARSGADVQALVAHFTIARALGEVDDLAGLATLSCSAKPRNRSDAAMLAQVFTTEDPDVAEAFQTQVAGWTYPAPTSAVIRLDNLSRRARGATHADLTELVRAEARDGSDGAERAILRASDLEDWALLAEVVRGRTVPRDQAVALRRLASRALKAGHLGDAAIIAEAVIRSAGGQPSARAVHVEATDKLGIVHTGWPVEPAREPSYDVNPRSTLSVLAQSLPHRSGGYATRSHGILVGLRRLGWDAAAVTRLGFPYDRWPRTSTDVVPAFDVVDDVTYRRILEPDERVYPQTPMSSYIERFAHRIEDEAIDRRAALIHASSFQNNGLAGLAAARRLGIPFVYEMRGLEDLMRVSRNPGFAETDAYRYLTGLENHIVANADLTFVITEALRDEMIRRGGPADRIEVLPNGVNTADFEPRSRDDALQAELGLTGRTVIGYAGGLVDYEGLDLLLEATALLKQERQDFGVVIVGDGHFEGRLRQLAVDLGVTDVVTFTGRVPHAEVPRYLSIFDITPFPRLPLPVCELISPIKPFEAMSMGKAVISSSVAALTEIVERDVRGLVFEKGSSEDLASQLRRYLDSPELRSRMGAQAREWVLAERDWSDVVTVVDAAYARLTRA
ncbi:glycosyltransferase family 4 protein [Intrasporangium sp. DVR]|uniref:glycosyltransferase family 4 protein n=1 Tax=Intrasporangium sp. DVR TaxID=3127867 RepID=UPI00313A6CBA